MSKKSTKIIAVAGVVAGLGVAALPALTFAASTSGQVTLSAEVQEAIAMTIEGNGDGGSAAVDVFAPATAAGKAVDGHTIPATAVTGPSSSTVSLLPNAADTETATSAVTVYTNSASGYTLSVKDADSTTALVNTDDSTATIPAGATITAGTAAWGYKGGTVSAFTAITASDADVYTQDGPTTNGHTTDMTYGVSTASTQKTGTYTDTIIYTATTN